MKTIHKVLLCSVLFSFSVPSLFVMAAPPQEEVNQVLLEINWTMEELEEYLAFYELTLNDFESI